MPFAFVLLLVVTWFGLRSVRLLVNAVSLFGARGLPSTAISKTQADAQATSPKSCQNDGTHLDIAELEGT